MVNKKATVGLSVVLKEEEVVAAADVGDAGSVRAAAVEMDEHNGSRAWCDGLLDDGIVDLKSVDAWLNENGAKTVLCDGKDGGDVGVGRNDDFVARLHDTQFDVGTENPYQRIQAVGTAYGVFGADKPCIIRFEAFVFLALQVPTAVYHTGDSRVDLVTVKGSHVFLNT